MPEPRRFFTDEAFDFETRIALGASAYRCAEAGEVPAPPPRRSPTATSTAGSTPGPPPPAASAPPPKPPRTPASAREARLRAAKYAGMAFFFVLGTRDPGRSLAHLAGRTAPTSSRRSALWPTPARRVAIPYEATTLDGWWLSGGDGDRPLAILNNGSDGTSGRHAAQAHRRRRARLARLTFAAPARAPRSTAPASPSAPTGRR